MGAEVMDGNLEEYLAHRAEECGVPGAVLVELEDGRIGRSAAAGVRHRARRLAMTVDTVFEAASLSKPVFAYLVLLLVQDGLLSLDVPLATYLPSEPAAFAPLAEILDDPSDERLWDVTARQVLSHSAGFGNAENDNARTINYAPGAGFLYSGQGYLFLQRVIEHLTGCPLAGLMSERVLQPLGMTSSSFVWETRFAPLMAEGHGTRPDTIGGRWPEAWSAWSLHSTAGDIARFGTVMLGAPGPLTPAGLDIMLSPAAAFDADLCWSLGWGLVHGPDGNAFWQWGDLYTFQHYAIGIPRTGRGLILMTNSDRGLHLAVQVAADCFGAAYALPVRTVLARGW